MAHSILEAVDRYISRGWAVIPVPYMQKRPVLQGWQHLDVKPTDVSTYFNGDPSNIGVLLGDPSGGLVDTDIDCDEALHLADKLLPLTGVIFGHGKSASAHRLYVVDGEPPNTTKFVDIDGSCLVEIRSTGAQTIFPTSVHPNGEPIEFAAEGDPHKLLADDLIHSVTLLACGSLLVRHWLGEGSRHDFAMAVAGTFGRAGYEQAEIETLLFEVAKLAGDGDPGDRKNVVSYTVEKLEKGGEPVTGLPTVAALVGDAVADKLGQWLGYKRHGDLGAHIAELNRRHAVVMIGGNCRVLNEEINPVTGQIDITYSSFDDFKRRYSNCIVVVGEDANGKQTRLPFAPVWLDHPQRRQYDRVVFAPGRDLPSCYNLWRGFAVAPNQGNCELYLDHLHDNVCGGDEALYRWLVGWMANTVQAPCDRPGTAVVLRGRQGVGKTIACAIFGSLFGPHFRTVSQARHLTGNFNAHLQDCLVLLAEEAFWAGDKRAEGVLKDLITGDTINIERKFVDVQTMPNFIRLMVTTNNDWAGPAGLEERRFCVLDVSDARLQDKPFFAAIANQMEDGGREALLHYLLTYDFSDVDLRSVPQTTALWEQKLHGMDPVTKFWFEALCDGRVLPEAVGWPEWVRTRELQDAYYRAAGKAGHGHKGWQTELGMKLKRLCPGLKKARRYLPQLDKDGNETQEMAQQGVYILPDLATSRAQLEQVTQTECPWPEVDYDWLKQLKAKI